jgi:proline iminopeptidase
MKIIITLLAIVNFMNLEAQDIVKIKNDYVTLNVKVYSGNNTEVVILLHGGPGVPDDMIAVINILKEKYKVITFDQRGIGQSNCRKCRFTMPDYISDIDSIADFFNLEKFHLFGHSWGGLYAQIYANQHPDKIKSLFLCSPSSGTNKVWLETEKEVMQFNKSMASKNEWLKMGWYSLCGMLGSNKAYRKLFKQVLINYHRGYLNTEKENDFFNKIYAKPINKTRKEIINYKILPRVENPNFPIMITYGVSDIYGVSRKKLISRFPTAKVKIINASGHIPWLHNLREFREILKEYYLG